MGSSRRRRSGFSSRAIESATRLRSPPERMLTGVSSGGRTIASETMSIRRSVSQPSQVSILSWRMPISSRSFCIWSSERGSARSSDISLKRFTMSRVGLIAVARFSLTVRSISR